MTRAFAAKARPLKQAAADLARPSAIPHAPRAPQRGAARAVPRAAAADYTRLPVYPATADAGRDHAATSSQGIPLDPATRARYEPALHADLSRVRVHTGSDAAASASSLDAAAYTLGSDVVFGAGRYRPGSPSGEPLLAHELAHVAQQSSASPAGPTHTVTHPGDRAERAASRAVPTLLAGGAVSLAPEPRAIARQGANQAPTKENAPKEIKVGDVGPGAEGIVLIRQWLEQHQFAPPPEQLDKNEQHVLLNGEDMTLTDAIKLVSDATHQPPDTVRSVITARLAPRIPISAAISPWVGPGNEVPGLKLAPKTWEDDLAIQRAVQIDTVDGWLKEHGFAPPEVRDPMGDRVVIDGQDSTIEQVADRVLRYIGPYPVLTRDQVLAHLRQEYVKARGGPGNQIVFGYTLVPKALQATTAAADPLNPTRTQHQFSFTITRQHHANDSPGLESSFQGSVAINDAGDIVNLQAGGQEAVVLPLLRGWIQVSGLVQVMAAANWNRTLSGSVAISPSVQAAAGGQLLVTPNFRSGPFQFLNGHVQFGVQALGTATAAPSGISAGGNVGFVLNIPFSL